MEDFEPRQEKDVVPARRLVVVGVVSIVIGVLAVTVQGAILKARTREGRLDVPAPSGTVEQTLIESTSRGPDLQAEQRKTLDELGWVDEQHGVARIPVDRAIDILVEREGRPR